nr:2-hydroxychromene-2-carboxylate isomerase [Henriciella litoralis]
MGRIDYWFEFGSTYSYLSTMRIGTLARERGVEVSWQPFLLGPIFAAQGWDTSPFNIYPAKGEYMWADMARQADKLGLPFRRLPPEGPGAFPQNGLLATRMALVGFDEGWGDAFTRAVFTAEFGEGRDVADQALLAELASTAGADGDVMARAQTDANKSRLRGQVERAMAAGIFGAPSFLVSGELYWGNDRLEEALEAAAGGKD